MSDPQRVRKPQAAPALPARATPAPRRAGPVPGTPAFNQRHGGNQAVQGEQEPEQFPQPPNSAIANTSAEEKLTELEQAVITIALELCTAVEEKRLIVGQRVKEQLEQLALTGRVAGRGSFPEVEISSALLKTLQALLQATIGATSTAPARVSFNLISLVRHGHGMHGKGRAVDISAFAGKRLHVQYPQEALEGVFQLIISLPPGFYALGLPRQPKKTLHDYTKYRLFFETTPLDGSTVLDFKSKFRNDRGEFALPNMFLRNDLRTNKSPTGKFSGDVMYIEDLAARTALITAEEIARRQGVTIVYIFPDAPDHVHLCTGESREDLRRC